MTRTFIGHEAGDEVGAHEDDAHHHADADRDGRDVEHHEQRRLAPAQRDDDGDREQQVGDEPAGVGDGGLPERGPAAREHRPPPGEPCTPR